MTNFPRFPWENTTMLAADRYDLALSTTSDAARDAYVTDVCPITPLAHPDAAYRFQPQHRGIPPAHRTD